MDISFAGRRRPIERLLRTTGLFSDFHDSSLKRQGITGENGAGRVFNSPRLVLQYADIWETAVILIEIEAATNYEAILN